MHRTLEAWKWMFKWRINTKGHLQIYRAATGHCLCWFCSETVQTVKCSCWSPADVVLIVSEGLSKYSVASSSQRYSCVRETVGLWSPWRFIKCKLTVTFKVKKINHIRQHKLIPDFWCYIEVLQNKIIVLCKKLMLFKPLPVIHHLRKPDSFLWTCYLRQFVSMNWFK